MYLCVFVTMYVMYVCNMYVCVYVMYLCVFVSMYVIYIMYVCLRVVAL
jgi:hypothetical protein